MGVVVAYLEVVRPGWLSRVAKRLRHVLWPTGLAALAFAVTWTLAAGMFLGFERPMLEAGAAIARRIDDRRA